MQDDADRETVSARAILAASTVDETFAFIFSSLLAKFLTFREQTVLALVCKDVTINSWAQTW